MTGEAQSGTEASPAGTGDDRVDAAVRRLDELDMMPTAEHVGRYDELHAGLQDILTATEQV